MYGASTIDPLPDNNSATVSVTIGTSSGTSLTVPTATGPYGGSVTFSVTLKTTSGTPVPGKTIGFNFSATDYMNSAGIGLIINLVEEATQIGLKVFAYGLGSHYRKLFSMVGLTERLILVADETELKLRAETS